jgi:disulfide bond formation protein DsbB
VDGYAITDMLETLSAVLAIGVAAGTLVVLGLWAAGRRDLLASVIALRSTITFLIATGATAGSLYFSEVANYVPCRLCWFQRIAMYPLAVIGLVGMLRNDRGARWHALPIAAVGAVISAWHNLIEWRPSLEGGTCSATGPSCADIWFRTFGFATLAFMALVAFLAIIVINLVPDPSEDTP